MMNVGLQTRARRTRNNGGSGINEAQGDEHKQAGGDETNMSISAD